MTEPHRRVKRQDSADCRLSHNSSAEMQYSFFIKQCGWHFKRKQSWKGLFCELLICGGLSQFYVGDCQIMMASEAK